MNFKIFSDPTQVARAAAAHWVDVNPRIVALSGGSTPRALYELLADPAEPFRAQVEWDKTHFFFTDERHVPPDHPDSNYRMVNEAMFSRVPVPPQNIHRIPAENPVAHDAAEAYETDLRRFFGEAIPAFDLILLGLGEDGHTASIFSVIHETTRFVSAPWVEKLNVYRITMTLPVLNNGKSVVFLVTGASKSQILREVINADKKPDLYPAQAIQPLNGELVWLVDKLAAAAQPTTPQTQKPATTC